MLRYELKFVSITSVDKLSFAAGFIEGFTEEKQTHYVMRPITRDSVSFMDGLRIGNDFRNGIIEQPAWLKIHDSDVMQEKVGKRTKTAVTYKDTKVAPDVIENLGIGSTNKQGTYQKTLFD